MKSVNEILYFVFDDDIKIIKYKQNWDYHNNIKFILLNDNEYVGSVELEEPNDKDFIKLQSLYIDYKYRGKGYSKILIEEALKETKIDIFLLVHKDNYIYNTYKRYGFEFYNIDMNDYDFYWLKKPKLKV